MRTKKTFSVGSIKIDDVQHEPHFVGTIRFPSGFLIHTSLPRKSRTSARKDAWDEMAVILKEVDLPIHLL